MIFPCKKQRQKHSRLFSVAKRLTESAREAGQWADKVESTKIGGRSKYEKSLDLRAYIGEKSRRMQMRRKNLEHKIKVTDNFPAGVMTLAAFSGVLAAPAVLCVLIASDIGQSTILHNHQLFLIVL